jgi:hypothetical protein
VTVTPIVSADGHVENFRADDANRDIRYPIIATRNRLAREHIQFAPDGVTEIDWLESSYQAERDPRSFPVNGAYRRNVRL